MTIKIGRDVVIMPIGRKRRFFQIYWADDFREGRRRLFSDIRFASKERAKNHIKKLNRLGRS